MQFIWRARSLLKLARKRDRLRKTGMRCDLDLKFTPATAWYLNSERELHSKASHTLNAADATTEVQQAACAA